MRSVILPLEPRLYRLIRSYSLREGLSLRRAVRTLVSDGLVEDAKLRFLQQAVPLPETTTNTDTTEKDSL